MRHTQAPWKFFANENPDEIQILEVKPEDGSRGWVAKTINICNAQDEILAEVKCYTTPLFMQELNEFSPNAKLIMAAPELLEVVEMFLRACYREDRPGITMSPLMEHIELAKAIVKKATL